MGSFLVTGGKKLKGEITPQGAKNEALQVISAVLLTEEKVIIHNIPNIIDVNLQIELLEGLGVSVERINSNSCAFRAHKVDPGYLSSPLFQNKTVRLRGSVMLAGPMLARFKKAYIPKPGGDKIGRRRLDTHIIGFKKLGAGFDYDTDESFFLRLSRPPWLLRLFLCPKFLRYLPPPPNSSRLFSTRCFIKGRVLNSNSPLVMADNSV